MSAFQIVCSILTIVFSVTSIAVSMYTVCVLYKDNKRKGIK